MYLHANKQDIKSSIEKPSANKTVQSSNHAYGTIQRYCPNCIDPNCNYGSICKQHTNPRGTHGYKQREQKELHTNGTTHESEHTVGFEPYNRHNTSVRKTKEGRAFENVLPAYQEEKSFHKSHIGTGTKSQADASGFNSRTYRDTQAGLLESSDFSSAVQLNQLAYAFQDGFQADPFGTSADLSFMNMTSLSHIPLPDEEGKYVQSALTPEERAEMALSRKAARTGVWPTSEERQAEYQKAMSRRPFAPDEDTIIREYIQTTAKTDWAELAALLVYRTPRQCRERWFQYLSPQPLATDPYSEWENELIQTQVETIGPKWSTIAYFLRDRTPHSIRAQWTKLQRKKQL